MELKLSRYNIIKEQENEILVYNSYTKASMFLEKDTDLSLFDDIKEFEKLDEGTKQLLLENGFVVDKEKDELVEMEYLFTKNYFVNNHLALGLIPTFACNFKCPYCCEKGHTCGKENVKKYFKTLRNFAKKSFHKHKIIQINLFGGEPLLYIKDAIKFLEWVEIDSKEHRYEYFISITTNGSLLTEDILEQLIKYNLVSLQITIDSHKENHDMLRIFKDGRPSFDLLMSIVEFTVSRLKEENDAQFVLRINLNNTTPAKVRETLEIVSKDNRPHINLMFRPVYNTKEYNEKNTNNTNELMQYMDMGQEIGYKILQSKFWYQSCEVCADSKFHYLLPDSSLWKCIHDLDYLDAKMGFIDEEGNDHIDITKTSNWFQKSSPFINEKCSDCKLLPDCMGGCILYKAKHCRVQCKTLDMASLPFIYNQK